MQIMGSEGVQDTNKPEELKPQEAAVGSADTGKEATEAADKEQEGGSMFGEGLASDTVVPGTSPQVTVTTAEKLSFLDSLVNNSRFVLSYKLFSGKASVAVRSMTFEETRALSEWCVREAPNDIGGQISGKFRRYLLCAQIEMFNGVKMPPLADPLFRTLDKDGKTFAEPGWIEQAKFWDDKPTAVISAISKCVADFNTKYDFLVSKAEDANFWNPDTP